MNRITVAKTVAYLIAAIAAITSYGHQVHLLELADLDPLFGVIPSEWVTPLTVDALAMIALVVRTSDAVTVVTKRWAMLPLVLAGGLSVAANVAMARNLIQVVVGVWTVLAYIVAELFVAKLERKSSAPAEIQETKAARRVTEAERKARKRAGYDSMTKAEKRAWTANYRRRTGSVAPVSPGHGPVSAPSVAEVAEAVR